MRLTGVGITRVVITACACWSHKESEAFAFNPATSSKLVAGHQGWSQSPWASTYTKTSLPKASTLPLPKLEVRARQDGVTNMKSSDSSRNSKIFRPLLQIGHRSDYTPGVDWSFVIGTPIVQAAILAVSLAAAGATLRAQLWSALHVSLRGVLLGAVSCLPPMALGLVLDKTKWDWVERMNASTREATLLLFGSKRLLWQVLPASIALGAVIGFLEECTFRGLLPMFIMLKAKMIPTAGIVAICSTIFGILHPATVAYSVVAALCGAYFHLLLLLSGDLLVPIVAHSLYDVVALMHHHIEGTAWCSEPEPEPAFDGGVEFVGVGGVQVEGSCSEEQGGATQPQEEEA